MFQKFNKGSPRGDAGQGLGLAISRGIVEAHGGELRCVDAPRGTTFRLTLPTSKERT
jgi:signal transduction histidine kinase